MYKFYCAHANSTNIMLYLLCLRPNLSDKQLLTVCVLFPALLVLFLNKHETGISRTQTNIRYLVENIC